MSRVHPFDWPVEKYLVGEDAEGVRFRITVQRSPASVSHNLGGSLNRVVSDARRYTLDSGLELIAGEDELEFTTEGSDEILRKV